MNHGLWIKKNNVMFNLLLIFKGLNRKNTYIFADGGLPSSLVGGHVRN